MKESTMASEDMIKLEFTGERMVPEHVKDDLVFYEHYSRYIFASQYVSDKTVLDIACGAGYGADLLLTKGARRVIGVDIDSKAVSYAKHKYEREGIEFTVGDAQKVALPDNSVDAVVSFETIEHLDDYQPFLSEIRRVIRDDGVIIISTPNSAVFPGNKFHTKEFGIEEFKNIFSQNYKNVEIYYQNNTLASSITTESFLNQDELTEEYRIRTYRAGIIDSNESMYVLAVCSNSVLPKFEESMLVDGGKELKKLYRTIQDLDAAWREAWDLQKAELEERYRLVNRELHEALCEIDRIHASVSWRISKPVRMVKPAIHKTRKRFT